MSYDFESIKSQNAYAEAEANGCYVKLPAPNELFIDIDDEKGAFWYGMNFSKVKEHIGVLNIVRGASPSGSPEHEHIVVTLARDVSPMERLLLQAILGSDLRREALSWVRHVNQDEQPTLFYEKKPLQIAANCLPDIEVAK